MSALSGIGSFMSGLASGASSSLRRQRELELDRRLAVREEEKTDGSVAPAADLPAPSTVVKRTSTRGGNAQGGQKAYMTGDPVWAGAAYQRALLNAIAGGESGGQYDIRYTPRGGAKFSSFDRHPGIYEQGPEGKSSAAGRYQFVKSTWDELGGGSFSPEMQDQRAWQLADQRYRQATGGDLATELQRNGLTEQTLAALSPTWAAFRSNRGRHIATYNDSLARYRTPGAEA